MSVIQDKRILITGGAGGIGRIMGEKLLNKGAACLVIWDIDLEKMQHAAEDLFQKGFTVFTYKVNLSKQDEIYKTANLVLDEVGPIDILVNNAGVVAGKLFNEYSTADIEKTLSININGVMHTTRAFIDAMLEQNSGHIVNISSAVSNMANPRMSAYTASKWAVTGWSETLRIELKNLNTNLRVTTVQPSYINTGMFAGVKTPLLTPLLEPVEIAKKIVSAIEKDKRVLREPFMVKLLPFLKGVLPSKIFDFVAGKIFGVYSSMKTFTGREPTE